MPLSALQQPPPREAPDRKSVLFCPACAYASPVDGDWITVRKERRDEFVCPECDGTVLSQPRL
ncbi:MAG: hypothetical protein R3324_03770 [Halobacteriales archaeon]|nr:hypothetical protein [Halobacteriales archaeon]